MAMVTTRESRRKPRPVNGATDLENCQVCQHKEECWGIKPFNKHPANAKCIRFKSIHAKTGKGI